jgi:hypothetical protein
MERERNKKKETTGMKGLEISWWGVLIVFIVVVVAGVIITYWQYYLGQKFTNTNTTTTCTIIPEVTCFNETLVRMFCQLTPEVGECVKTFTNDTQHVCLGLIQQKEVC